MYKQIKYDFSNLEHIMGVLKKSERNQTAINDLKKELNKFFKDSKCLEVIVTRNTDKPFFGMCVYPDLSNVSSVNVVSGTEDIRINTYSIEIDSQLLSSKFDFTAKELTAIILHEVGHMVNDAVPIRKLRKAIDKYQFDTRSSLNLSNMIGHKEFILKFGIIDSLRKITSMFENEENAADEFVFMCGYGDDLESALKKLKINTPSMYKQADNKLIAIGWTIRLYSSLSLNRIPAIHMLNKASRITGSEFEKKAMETLKKRLEVIEKWDEDADDGVDRSMQENCIYGYGYLAIDEGKLGDTISKMKYKGVKAFDSDYYEYLMRARNTTDEYDALLLMRQINTRISILNEFIEEEGKNMSERQRNEYFNMIDKFIALRDKLAVKATYREKGDYTIVVNYPEIKDCR